MLRSRRNQAQACFLLLAIAHATAAAQQQESWSCLNASTTLRAGLVCCRLQFTLISFLTAYGILPPQLTLGGGHSSATAPRYFRRAANDPIHHPKRTRHSWQRVVPLRMTRALALLRPDARWWAARSRPDFATKVGSSAAY